ncbi:phosphotransferase [Asanoa sp. NPDC049518]|uniref:phosphotransferase n=1 Tax=unclassified Asanoa TaxID=2685164 RepID=UPI003412F6C4
MRDWPAELTKADLVEGLSRGWGLDVETVDYLPVGAGSYHWSAAADGRRWFVTVDEVSGEGRFDALDRALATAVALRDLDFVVAPVAGLTGAVTRRLTGRHAMSVHPFVDGTAGPFGPHPPEDREPMVDLLAALHLATPTVASIAPRTDLRLPGREGLHAALSDAGSEWRTGPYAEPARDLLATNGARVTDWLDAFDRLVAEVRATTPTWVITHGEPHPGNVLQTTEGRRLVDWETTLIAPPERDLWMLTSADPGAEDLLVRYTAATGVPVSRAALDLYRLWWTLADVAAFVTDLRRPHTSGGDAADALEYLASYFPTNPH